MNLVERIKNILLSPAAEWETIKKEDYMISDLFTQYAIKLAAIVASLIVYGVTGSIITRFAFGGHPMRLM